MHNMTTAITILAAIAILIMGWIMGRWSIQISKRDPFKNCIVYKSEDSCSHVDGFLCDYNKCTLRLEAEMFELENQLEIPMELRYHNREKKQYKK